jgi:hypothetical protein
MLEIHHDNLQNCASFAIVRKISVAAIVIAALILSGCTAAHSVTKSAPTPGPKQPGMSAAQAAVIAKGHIDYTDYQAGLRRYIACVGKAGYAIKVTGSTNEIDDLQIPAAAVSSGAEPTCYTKEFKQIDINWQMSRSNTSPEAEAYHNCLVAKGVTPAATEGAMVKQLSKLGISPSQCLNSTK